MDRNPKDGVGKRTAWRKSIQITKIAQCSRWPCVLSPITKEIDMEWTIGGLMTALILGFTWWKMSRPVKSPLSDADWF
jgi:hypothetical protein